MELLLGIDVGTSATKAVLCDAAGRAVATGAAEHPSSRPQPGWSEQDPRDWWRSSVGATRAVMGEFVRSVGKPVDPARVVGIGLSGQMHGSVLLGREAATGDGERAEPLRPALLWNDQRTSEECREIEERAGG